MGGRWTRVVVAVIALLLLSACGRFGSETKPPAESAAFDVAQVRANFTDTCSDAVSDEELMCSQIEVDQMSGDEDTLIVSTTLDPSSKSQGQAICEWIALLYFDGVTGQDLGYRLVDIRDRDDGNAAACSVEQ